MSTPSPAAIHEAAHATLAAQYYRRPKAELTSAEGGRVLATEYDDRNKRQITEDIHIALAGGIAEFLAFGTGAGIDNDITDALAHLRHLNPKATLSDLQPHIAKVTDALSSPTTWSKVQALAAQLQRKRILTQDQIDKILRLDYPAARPPHAGARIKFAVNPDYVPEKVVKAVVINKGNQPYRVFRLQDFAI